MIGIRKSDEPLLDTAASAVRADRNALRAAIRQSDALAARSDAQAFASLLQSVRTYVLRHMKGRHP